MSQRFLATVVPTRAPFSLTTTCSNPLLFQVYREFITCFTEKGSIKAKRLVAHVMNGMGPLRCLSAP